MTRISYRKMISAVCENLRYSMVFHDVHVSEVTKQPTSISPTAICGDFIAGVGT